MSSPGSNSGSGTRPAPTGGPETARDAPHRPRKSPPQQAKHPTTPSPREVPAGGGRIEPQSFLFHYGMAVTAGSGPQTERKAASRRGRPKTHRRPGPRGDPAKAQLLWGEEERMEWSGYPPRGMERNGIRSDEESRPVSFSAEKEMDLAPAGQAPPGGTPPPRRGAAPRRAAAPGGGDPLTPGPGWGSRRFGRPRRSGSGRRPPGG